MEEDDAFESIREATYVEEAGEIAAIVSSVSRGGPSSAQAAYPRFRQILEKYQENPQLLDPHLGDIVAPLAATLHSTALPAKSPEGLPRIKAATTDSLKGVCIVGQLLWAVVSVRGCKVVVKFFPQAAVDFEPMVDVLEGLNANALDGQAGRWEAQCVVLLWLSQMVLLPFKLALLDSSLNAESRVSTPPLVRQLVALCTHFLSSPASSRDMAGLLLGRLLTRPDTLPALQGFLSWCLPALDPMFLPGMLAIHASFHFCSAGVTHALAAICKSGQREVLLQFVPQIWPSAVKLMGGNSAASSALSRKLAVKLIQRIGMILLPPRDASWRYVSNFASLHASLTNGHATNGIASTGGEAAEQLDENVPEQVEEVLGLLLQSLRDSDTIVRWSASKGLGRISARLPKDFADEVVEQIVELFQEVNSDTAWHGACLALAELARRGLLLPERLASLAPHIAHALQFEVRRGAHSVGAHVRDAAAYVCWAFARAYSAQTLAPTVATLAPSLLTMACYDREVNCRRAASAAFQENVGRQGNFPHGINILTAADYFALSSRARAYQVVAPYIASFPEYNISLRTHLLHVKLRHWEKSLRELAASAAARLVPTAPDYFSTAALDELLPWCLDSSLEIAHGALLGVAEIVLACCNAQQPVALERQVAIADLVGKVANSRLYRGKGAELLRSAHCRLIECISLARLPLSAAQQACTRAMLDDNLMHASAAIQSQAALALGAFCLGYLRPGHGTQAGNSASIPSEDELGAVAMGYAAKLQDTSSIVRQGCAVALGALPPWLLRPAASTILPRLAEATKAQGQAEKGDAESRVAAVNALTAVTATLLGAHDQQQPSPTLAAGQGNPALSAGTVRTVVVATLLEAMKDYSIDNRGDVGSWVREAAMASLSLVLPLLQQLSSTEEDLSGLEAAVLSAVQAFLKQAVERIGRVREAAVKQLGILLQVQPPLPGIASQDNLAALLADLDTHPSSLKGVFQVSALLADPQYRPAVLEGLVFSIGGVDGALGKAAAAALAERTEGAGGEEIMRSFLDIWRCKARPPRLVIPLLKAADVLLPESDAEGSRALSLQHAGELLELVTGEVHRCRQVPCLCAAASVLCRMVQCAEPVRSRALTAVCKLMVSKYPKVRKAAAEHLYLQLLLEDDSQELVCDVLLSNSWDGPLEEAKEASSKILYLLGLDQRDTAAE